MQKGSQKQRVAMLLHTSVWVLQTANGEPETKSFYAVVHVSVGFTDCRRRDRKRVFMLLHKSVWVLQTAEGEPETKSCYAVAHVSVGFTDCRRGARHKELSCCCTRQCGFYRLQKGSQKQRVVMLLYTSEWVLQTAEGEPETKSCHADLHVRVGFTDCRRGARNKELSC